MTADLMQSEYNSNMEFLSEMQENLVDSNLQTREMLEKFIPKPFDFDSVLAQSKKFYDFVNAK